MSIFMFLFCLLYCGFVVALCVNFAPLCPLPEQGHHDPNNPTPTGEKIFKDDELEQLIDPILKMDDGNKDGFIDYPEFVQAQQKAGGGGRQPS
jgi:hypothetical protein